MATFNTIGLAEPSTITKKLASITLTRNSSATHQELMTLADPESTAALVRVITGTPSTEAGLVTRGVVYQSTATDLLARVSQGPGNSTAADRWRVNVANSSAADYVPVRIVDGPGTGFATPAIDYTHGSTLTASTVAGPTVLLRASSTTPAAVSTSDMFVAQWGTLNGAANVALVTQAGGQVEGSTSAPSSNALGIVVRPVVSGLQSYAASTTGQSSATTIVSSAAGSKAYVYAYTITSTIAGSAPQCGFYDGATLKWPVKLSSGHSGANLAVSPPAYLFAGSTGAALTFNVADSNAGMSVGIAYWISA